MGNSLGVVSNSGTPPFPCRLQLGKSAAIDLSRSTATENGEKWTALYTVDGSTCELSLTKRVDKDLSRCLGKNNNDMFVFIDLSDSVYLPRGNLGFGIQRTETNFLQQCLYLPCPNFRSMMWNTASKTVDAWGGITLTMVFLYGSGNRMGLVVEELKKIREDEPGYYNSMTVAHYFANGSGTAFTRAETDIGLSVVAKIRPSNANFDITVEGPEQHPSSALFYMFDQVYRTGTWKPTMCPHCTDIRRQRSRMCWQSDSEDSDGVPVPPRRASQQNASIANDGRFKGNGNGSFIKCKYFYGF